MRISLFCSLFACLLILPSCKPEKPESGVARVIPVPVKMIINPGYVRITDKTAVICSGSDEQLLKTAEIMAFQLKGMTGFPFEVKNADRPVKNSIFLGIDTSLYDDLGNEGYTFNSGNRKIEIKAATAKGIFFGIQTLYQLLPSNIPAENQENGFAWQIPSVEITDYPRFSWRGMHLDVSRHFFPVEFIKKYIDLIAMHKMNIFHWHLTDDNGWRIEIKQYPLLTETSAWRVDRESLPWGERPLQQPGEKATYGGFYTQEEIRDVVKYAADRFVTVIPEIEMPGHTSEVFAAYPELSCKGERLAVQPGSYWPNTDIFCAGKEETFIFLENVLREVAGLFPSEYIHIGGDEADKKEWKACPLCQARIKNEHLSGEEELQSYFIRRIEKVLDGMGKKLIGWDEILEGGLAPEATVMSWQGFEGGIEAAGQGHDVIMCPTNYCYFDYYQADPEFEPEAIGGLVTLKKVYSFDPVPSELTREDAKHILGGQGNVWTEYISTPEKVEYMAVPRMTALAEVLWSPRERLNWDDFRTRLRTQFDRFNMMNVKYSGGSARVLINTTFDTLRNQLFVSLETETIGTRIYFSLDGSEPGINSQLYSGPFEITESVPLKAQAWKDNKGLEKPACYNISVHPGIGFSAFYLEKYSERYPAGGSNALKDGLKGSTAYNDGMWQGFNGNNLDMVLKIDQSIDIHSVAASFLQDQKKWIFLPEQVVIYVSEDGKNFEELTAISHNIPQNTLESVSHLFEYNSDKPQRVNYLRIKAVNMGACPDWHPGKGGKAWIFADEIVIN